MREGHGYAVIRECHGYAVMREGHGYAIMKEGHGYAVMREPQRGSWVCAIMREGHGYAVMREGQWVCILFLFLLVTGGSNDWRQVAVSRVYILKMYLSLLKSLGMLL